MIIFDHDGDFLIKVPRNVWDEHNTNPLSHIHHYEGDIVVKFKPGTNDIVDLITNNSCFPEEYAEVIHVFNVKLYMKLCKLGFDSAW